MQGLGEGRVGLRGKWMQETLLLRQYLESKISCLSRDSGYNGKSLIAYITCFCYRKYFITL